MLNPMIAPGTPTLNRLLHADQLVIDTDSHRAVRQLLISAPSTKPPNFVRSQIDVLEAVLRGNAMQCLSSVLSV